jgi:hypothetical protein
VAWSVRLEVGPDGEVGLMVDRSIDLVFGFASAWRGRKQRNKGRKRRSNGTQRPRVLAFGLAKHAQTNILRFNQIITISLQSK